MHVVTIYDDEREEIVTQVSAYGLQIKAMGGQSNGLSCMTRCRAPTLLVGLARGLLLPLVVAGGDRGIIPVIINVELAVINGVFAGTTRWPTRG